MKQRHQPKPMLTTETQPWRTLAASMIQKAAEDYIELSRHGLIRGHHLCVDKFQAMTNRMTEIRRKARGMKDARFRMEMTEAKSAVDFFNSAGFESLCEFLNINAAAIRDKVRQSEGIGLPGDYGQGGRGVRRYAPGQRSPQLAEPETIETNQ